MDRQEIFEILIEEQESQIASLQNAVNEYKAASDLDESDTVDREDLSHQDEAKDMQLRYENMLSDAQSVLLTLKEIADNQYQTVETGSIIETEDSLFLIGIPLPKTSVKDKVAIGITEKAPVFNDLQNKKMGDSIKLGDNTAKIIRVM